MPLSETFESIFFQTRLDISLGEFFLKIVQQDGSMIIYVMIVFIDLITIQPEMKTLMNLYILIFLVLDFIELLTHSIRSWSSFYLWKNR